MTEYIKCYALTETALKALLPTINLEAPKLDPAWFDWGVPLPLLSAKPASLQRLVVMKDARYDEVKQRWIEAANRLGVLPILIATIDDEPPGSDWPALDDMALKRSINGYEIRRHKAATTADKSVSLPELSDGPVFEIVPIEARDATDLERLRDELVMPEQQVLDAWVGVLTDDKEEFWGIEAHPLVWRAYAKGLQEWAARPHLYEQHLRRLGEPPYQLSVPEVALDWNDFEYRPEASSLSSQRRNSLYIPCKWAPFCGIGYEEGKPKAFGLLMPDASGNWDFGPQLKLDLETVLSETSIELKPTGVAHHIEVQASGGVIRQVVDLGSRLVKSAKEAIDQSLTPLRTVLKIDILELAGSHGARADNRRVASKKEWQQHVLIRWEQDGQVWTIQGRVLDKDIELELSFEAEGIRPIQIDWGDYGSEEINQYRVTQDEQGRWLISDLYVSLARIRAKHIRAAASPQEQSVLLPTVKFSKE